jgi:hypothetical protein
MTTPEEKLEKRRERARDVMRYTIMARPHNADYDVEICEVQSNPRAVASAVAAKKEGRGKSRYRYARVWIRDNEPPGQDSAS